MAGLVTKPANEINTSLVKFLPELKDSKYAKYPMKHERWYEPTETAPNGEPCYVPSSAAAAAGDGGDGAKQEYVFCRKTPQGMKPGYFSLMTHVAYVNLYDKLDSVRPTPGGCCGIIGGDPTEKVALDQWDDVKRVIWSRQLASKPDDEFAAKAAMDFAKGKADSVYRWTQNEQLVVNAVGTTAFVATG